MILFKPEMVEKILAGEKTVTRRRGRRRWNVGAIHQCYTRPPFAKGGAEPFARVRIRHVLREARPMRGPRSLALFRGQVGAGAKQDLEREARREGFSTWAEFRATYMEINGPAAIDDPCWRVVFEVA